MPVSHYRPFPNPIRALWNKKWPPKATIGGKKRKKIVGKKKEGYAQREIWERKGIEDCNQVLNSNAVTGVSLPFNAGFTLINHVVPSCVTLPLKKESSRAAVL